jgi:hypothetical protein
MIGLLRDPLRAQRAARMRVGLTKWPQRLTKPDHKFWDVLVVDDRSISPDRSSSVFMLTRDVDAGSSAA